MSLLTRILTTLAPACLFASLCNAEVVLAVRGETVHTMNGQALRNGVVLINDAGKIEQVGANVQVPAGVRTIEAKVVTPGLIDARTIVGLQGFQNEPRENDVIERSAPVQPELRAADAFNGRERLLEWVRGFGITTIHTGPAPGTLMPGQTLVIKTAGPTVDDGCLDPEAMVCVTLGDGGLNRGDGEGGRRSPGTRSKQIAMLRAEFIAAREYLAKRDRAATQPSTGESEDGDDKSRKSSGGRDLRKEVLVQVLKKEKPLLIYAQRAQDILAALKFAREFDVNIVLDGACESYLMIDAVKAAGVPVIVHASMKRSGGEAENLSFETAAKLHAAGVPIAMQSGFEDYVPKTRVVLLEAAIAAANGLPVDATLAALTIDAAKILGVAGKVGSLEAGKDADLALFDGDPFEYTTHCVGTVIDGKLVFEGRR